jgi:tRNA pseudouridine65 synthase
MSKVPILLQDKDWLIVDKPYGLSVHNNEDPENLIKVLSTQCGIKDLLPVHRLDKETSGVQIFALNKKSAKKLSEEFQQNRVEKNYQGLVKGIFKTKAGLWNKPLTDKAEGRRSPQGLARNRVPCQTEYKVIKESAHLSLCEFRIITGRQHQIRKHTALAKHPLVGDSRYGSKALNEKIKELHGETRMFLHCQKIEVLGVSLFSQSTPGFDVFFG